MQPSLVRSNKLTWTKLHCAVSYADVKTLRILSKVQWMTTDVGTLVNGVTVNENVWAARRIINSRRLEKLAQMSESSFATADAEPEEVFLAFTALFRKMVDDHYGSIEKQNNTQSFPGEQRESLTGNELEHEAIAEEDSLMKLEPAVSEQPKSDNNGCDGNNSSNVVTSTANRLRHRLPLWSTTTCGQRGKLKANTSAPLRIWNPPFHIDWAAIESLFFDGKDGSRGNEDRKLFACGARVMIGNSTW